MWELMRIGLEMQERMIEAHGKSLEMAREMLDATEAQAQIGSAAVGMNEAMQRAGKAQADLLSRWIGFWGGRS